MAYVTRQRATKQKTTTVQVFYPGTKHSSALDRDRDRREALLLCSSQQREQSTHLMYFVLGPGEEHETVPYHTLREVSTTDFSRAKACSSLLACSASSRRDFRSSSSAARLLSAVARSAAAFSCTARVRVRVRVSVRSGKGFGRGRGRHLWRGTLGGKGVGGERAGASYLAFSRGLQNLCPGWPSEELDKCCCSSTNGPSCRERMCGRSSGAFRHASLARTRSALELLLSSG